MSWEHAFSVAVKEQRLQRSTLCLHTATEQLEYGKGYQMTTELNSHKAMSQADVGPQLVRSACVAHGASSGGACFVDERCCKLNFL